MRIEYDDDLVVVYDRDGNEVYRGLEDYEPMKYEPWEYDEDYRFYRFGGYIKMCLPLA